MPADKLTFLQKDLDHLSSDEKCIFIQAGIILTELRFFDLQLHTHIAYIRKGRRSDGAEIGILLSQITLLLAQLSGKLVEAHNVIKKSFYLPTVSKKYAPLLSTECAEALSRIKLYFSDKNNLASTLRNNFGFHYDRERILDFVNGLPPTWEHNAYLTGCLNDSFVEFGQTCSMHALFSATGASNSVEGLLKSYGELAGTLTKDFVIFFHGILEAISSTITIRSEKIRIKRKADSPALYMPRIPGIPRR